MSERDHLSIGEVLTHVQEEFPDVSISKIRFLESQGLIEPERTPSGYRQFFDHDVARLRWILLEQRDNFLPLKVIRERLDAGFFEQWLADGGGAAPPPATLQPSLFGSDEPAADEPIDDAEFDVDESSADTDADISEVDDEDSDDEMVDDEAGEVVDGEPDEDADDEDADHEPPDDEDADDGPADADEVHADIVDLVTERERLRATLDNDVDDIDAVMADAEVITRADDLVDAAAEADVDPIVDILDQITVDVDDDDGSDRFDDSSLGDVGALDGDGEPPPIDTSPDADTSPGGDTSPVEAVAAPVDPVEHDVMLAAARRAVESRSRPEPEAPAPVPEPEAAPAPAPVPGRMAEGPLDPGATSVSMTVDELSRATGLSPDQLGELERYGLLATRQVGPAVYYDGDAMVVAKLAAAFLRHGVEARHLRMYKTAAEREAGVFEQVVAPYIRRTDAESRHDARERLVEMARLGEALHAALLRVTLKAYTDP